MHKKNALLSVYTKEGIDVFARGLVNLGWVIYSSGGTAKFLREAGIEVADTAEYIGYSMKRQIAEIASKLNHQLPTEVLDAIEIAFGKPIMNHRVATLWPQIHGGILCRDEVASDLRELEEMFAVCFDLVCVDLYPMQAEIARDGSTLESVIEKTDIGGPTLLRSAAKGNRIVICDPADRQLVINTLTETGEVDADTRNHLAAKAETYVTQYCLASAMYRSNDEVFGVVGKLAAPCKYGENGCQSPAGFFTTGNDDPLALDKFALVAGDTPSYNNFCDIDRLLQSITHIAATFAVNRDQVPHIAVAVKHGNACGAAIGLNPTAVLMNTVMGDPEAIFGGLLMTNFHITEALAEIILKHGIPDGETTRKLDGILAPSFSPEAIELLKRKKDKCRFLANPALGQLTRDSLDVQPRFRYVRGGFLLQPNYTFILNLKDERLVYHGELSTQQEDDLLLAKPLCDTGNSNTVTLVRDGRLIGNGTGQQHRGWASKLAVDKAHYSQHRTKGSVGASDSFFPMTDGPKILCDNGVAVIFASSGSISDKLVAESIASAGVTFVTIADKIGRGFFGH